MFDFTGKIVVVTGGETGIGRATAEAFARAKATVVIAGFLEDEGQQTVDALKADKTPVEFMKIDVRDEASISATIGAIAAKHGRIDILVNNAAVFDGFAGVNETTSSLWDKVIDTNLKGTYLVCREVLKHMMPVGQGTIVNMSSIGGLVGGADGAAYTASKFGIIGLTRQMATDLSGKGIRVNAVCPGVIQTEMRKHSTRILGDDAPPMKGVGVASDVLKRIPKGRRGVPSDIAKAVLFAASDYSDYMTGHSLVIDGGWTIM